MHGSFELQPLIGGVDAGVAVSLGDRKLPGFAAVLLLLIVALLPAGAVWMHFKRKQGAMGAVAYEPLGHGDAADGGYQAAGEVTNKGRPVVHSIREVEFPYSEIGMTSFQQQGAAPPLSLTSRRSALEHEYDDAASTAAKGALGIFRSAPVPAHSTKARGQYQAIPDHDIA